jgi:hypothetical protein
MKMVHTHKRTQFAKNFVYFYRNVRVWRQREYVTLCLLKEVETSLH